MTGPGGQEGHPHDLPGREGGLAEPGTARPLLRVVAGAPDDAELAALTVVVAALAAASAPEEPRPASTWSNRGDLLRRPLPTGPYAWRMSTWPR